eukprot:412174-Pyramimonas_sp.AAC.1
MARKRLCGSLPSAMALTSSMAARSATLLAPGAAAAIAAASLRYCAGSSPRALMYALQNIESPPRPQSPPKMFLDRFSNMSSNRLFENNRASSSGG